MAQGIHLLDLHIHPVAHHVGATELAPHQPVLAGAVLVPVVLERADVHQTFHLGGRHFHEEAVALHATDHPGHHLTHQRLGLPGLGHGEGIGLNLLQEASSSLEPLGQPVVHAS